MFTLKQLFLSMLICKFFQRSFKQNHYIHIYIIIIQLSSLINVETCCKYRSTRNLIATMSAWNFNFRIRPIQNSAANWIILKCQIVNESNGHFRHVRRLPVNEYHIFNLFTDEEWRLYLRENLFPRPVHWLDTRIHVYISRFRCIHAFGMMLATRMPAL